MAELKQALDTFDETLRNNRDVIASGLRLLKAVLNVDVGSLLDTLVGLMTEIKSKLETGAVGDLLAVVDALLTAAREIGELDGAIGRVEAVVGADVVSAMDELKETLDNVVGVLNDIRPQVV